MYSSVSVSIIFWELFWKERFSVDVGLGAVLPLKEVCETSWKKKRPIRGCHYVESTGWRNTSRPVTSMRGSPFGCYITWPGTRSKFFPSILLMCLRACDVIWCFSRKENWQPSLMQWKWLFTWLYLQPKRQNRTRGKCNQSVPKSSSSVYIIKRFCLH